MMSSSGLTLGLVAPPWPPYWQVRSAVELASSLSLEVCSTWDHLVEFEVPSSESGPPEAESPAPFEYQVLLGALAAHAGSVRLQVGVTELLRRHPVVVGQAFVTLAHITERAPIVGIGAGERINTEPVGLWTEAPVARLEEGLAVLRACFVGESPLTHAGERFELRELRFELRPPADRMPEIWVGGRGPRMRRLAGRFGDGWYPTDIVDPTVYERDLADVKAAAAAAGRDAGDLTPAAELVVFSGGSASSVAEALRSDEARLFGLLLSGGDWREAGYEHPFGEDHRGVFDHDPALVTREALDAVPVDLVARHALTGTPAEIAKGLLALREAGLRHANLSFGTIEASTAATIRSVVHAIRQILGG